MYQHRLPPVADVFNRHFSLRLLCSDVMLLKNLTRLAHEGAALAQAIIPPAAPTAEDISKSSKSRAVILANTCASFQSCAAAPFARKSFDSTRAQKGSKIGCKQPRFCLIYSRKRAGVLRHAVILRIACVIPLCVLCGMRHWSGSCRLWIQARIPRTFGESGSGSWHIGKPQAIASI